MIPIIIFLIAIVLFALIRRSAFRSSEKSIYRDALKSRYLSKKI